MPFIVWSMDIYQFNLYYVTLMPKAQRHYSFQRDNLSCRVVSDYQLLLIVKRMAVKLHKYLHGRIKAWYRGGYTIMT